MPPKPASGRGMPPKHVSEAFLAAKQGQGALTAVIAGARASGQLNLSARGLDAVPSAVYDYSEAVDGGQGGWWEVAELSKLDLSRNEISVLPEGVFGLTALTSLDISANRLTALPPGLEQLQQLRSLSLSNNPQLGALPDSLAALPALASLSCASCGLTVLPEQLGSQQQGLAVLSAGSNRFTALPSGLAGATALFRLELAGNALDSLDPRLLLAWAASLTELDLSQNKLQALPPEIGRLSRLKLLKLRENQLAALPPSLAACSCLLELHVGFNGLKVLPPELGLLGQLRVMDLRNNLLQEFPDAACGLQLTLLDLSNNSLRSLPPRLGTMTTLRSMPLNGNPLKLVRRELWQGPISALLEHLRSRLPDPNSAEAGGGSGAEHRPAGALGVAAGAAAFGGPASTDNAAYTQPVGHAKRAAAPAADDAIPAWPPSATASGRAAEQCGSQGGAVGKLASSQEDAAKKLVATQMVGQQLVLAGRGLTAVPEEVWEATRNGLRQLDLSSNALGSASFPPSAFLQCSSLCSLSLASCGLSSWPLPPVDGALGALVTLDLRANSIAVLPEGAFVACPKLRHLDLSGVPGAASLPAGCLQPLQCLETLSLASTGLSILSEQVLAASSLKTINLSSNRLSSLPEQITQLTRLEELLLTNNALTSLPPKLGLMAPTLRHVALDGNAFRTIRRPLLEGSTSALLEWLKGRVPAVG